MIGKKNNFQIKSRFIFYPCCIYEQKIAIILHISTDSISTLYATYEIAADNIEQLINSRDLKF